MPQYNHVLITLQRPKIYLLDMFEKRFGRRFQSKKNEWDCITIETNSSLRNCAPALPKTCRKC